ncbi:hypothetical protein B0H67DRAFT_647080 [Lasiosphaeris hirsuta]|uniref:Uncharacterized protein n=1 Tax=Lasiosphaeris hirsuta TaxID=260670 RepID=A0AA40A9H9_9PEZI|nr:hypothetical protein B0H67DRAFT_647080 [Lasiosphaeris hirsuta]
MTELKTNNDAAARETSHGQAREKPIRCLFLSPKKPIKHLFLLPRNWVSQLPLTRKNLARLDALNGDSKKRKDSAYFESDTMPISTTASAFEQQAYENGILGPTASRAPHDLGTLDSDDFEDKHYEKTASRAITQIPQRDFNRGLSDPQPDLLDDLVTDTLPHHLHDHTLHGHHSLALCHLAIEFKRLDGNLRQAICQAAYDGAVLVYARNRALAHARANVLGGTAAAAAAIDKAAAETAVLTCVTDGKVAEVFTHHFWGGKYHQSLVAIESLLAYPNRGRELIRNAQDYARRKSYELAALLGANL